MSRALIVPSDDEMRRAVVLDGEDGSVIRYYRALRRGGEVSWLFDHEAQTALPFHAALDLAHAMVNR